MILFFGTRVEQTHEAVLAEDKHCPHCNVIGKFKISIFRKYFHFFFIPVYTSERFSYLQCMHCKKKEEKETN